MLRIYPVLLELVRSLAPLVRQLERCDPDLRGNAGGRFAVRRSMSPRAVTTAAKIARRAITRRRITARSARVRDCGGVGYLPEVDSALRGRFDYVLGTLVRLVGGH